MPSGNHVIRSDDGTDHMIKNTQQSPSVKVPFSGQDRESAAPVAAAIL